MHCFEPIFGKSGKRPGRQPLRGCGLFCMILCGFVCFSTAGPSQAQRPAEPAPTPIGTLFDVGGYRVHIYRTGSGSPTVMIVGAAFSFDWDLVQDPVSKFARVCTFDPSGTAWSDPFLSAARALDPAAPPRSIPTCADRVDEIRRVIRCTPVESPLILVGFSVGALWERLYAIRYPEGIAGMVIVDHEFLPDKPGMLAHPANALTSSRRKTEPAMVTQSPLVFGFEDDVHFGRLPQRDQASRIWASAQHPLRPDEAMASDCFAQLDRVPGKQPFPLGNVRLTVIRTENDSPGYAKMQAKLLGLSRDSRQVVAWKSSHMVPIDAPEVLVSAIRSMVERARVDSIGQEGSQGVRPALPAHE